MDIKPSFISFDRYTEGKFQQKLSNVIKLASSLHADIAGNSDTLYVSGEYNDKVAERYIQQLVRDKSNVRAVDKDKEYKILSKIEDGLKKLTESLPTQQDELENLAGAVLDREYFELHQPGFSSDLQPKDNHTRYFLEAVILPAL